MSPWSTVEFARMVLGLVAKILDPVDVVLLVCEEFRVIDPEVLEIGNIQHIVTPPEIGIDNAVRHDLAFHNWHQRGV